MTQLTHREKLERAVTEQRQWVEQCGGTRDGYIAKYHGTYHRTIENAEAIYEADSNALAYLEERLRRTRR